MRGCQQSITVMAPKSRAVQDLVALLIPVTGPGFRSAFTDRTHAKQQHVCATRRISACQLSGNGKARYVLHLFQDFRLSASLYSSGSSTVYFQILETPLVVSWL